jgi:hypothetical protein
MMFPELPVRMPVEGLGAAGQSLGGHRWGDSTEVRYLAGVMCEGV